MDTEPETRTTTLGAELTDRLPVDTWSEDPAVLILPERLHNADGITYAAFRQEAQSLRTALRDAGFTVHLAVPPGARKATYEEHDASWVLPILMSLGPLPMEVLGSVIGNWITAQIEKLGPKARITYREGHCSADGAIDVLEITGAADGVVRAIEARFEQ